MRKLLTILITLFLAIPAAALAGDLPAGYVYRVLNNTPGTWQTFSFTYTPTVTGYQYVMFAFRQDPAYWRMDNVSVTAPGSSTNLITNGNMNTGGSLTVSTTNYGNMSIQAPTAWGVSYQAGVYPSAAGMWTGGLWYDGAVGSYDGIYQGINLNAGVTYTITFQVNGDNTATPGTSAWQLAVYMGACAAGALNPSQCTIPTSSGFTTVASPSQTYSTGCGNSCPTPPPTTPTYPPATITSSEQVYINQTSSLGHNTVYIYQTGGDYTNISVTQTGDYNAVRGIGGGALVINGGSDRLSVTQGSQTVNGNHNLFEASINGSSNNITATQQGNSNYEQVNLIGSFNTLNTTQSGGNKAIFNNVNGNNNSITTSQIDTGNHFLELNIPTSGNTVSVTQAGNAQKLFSLTINSANVGVTVVQDNATTPDSAAMTITCNVSPCTGYTYTKH